MFVEALNHEVAGMHTHQGHRFRGNRVFVVADACLVRCADFFELSSTGLHDVGQPVAAADLNKLAARDDHFPVMSEGGQRKQRGTGVVIDDGCGFAACDSLQQPCHRGAS